MKGKNILVTAACVIGFGGIIGNTLVGVATSRELNKKINDVRNDAKEADERYDASTRAHLERLIEETRDSITDTYVAGQQAMQARLDEALVNIAQAQRELEESITEDMDAEIAALRTQLVNQLNALATQLAGTLSSLGNDVAALEAAQAQLAATLEDVQERVETLEGQVEELEYYMDAVIDAVVDIYGLVEALDTRLTNVSNNLNTLANYLTSNYYTIAEIDQYVGVLGTALNTLQSYFLVGTDIKTMAQIVNEMSELDGDMTAFNGAEATDAKAQYIEELFAIIAAYEHDVQHTYDQIVTAYGVQSLAVPGAITTLKDNLLASAGLSALKDKMMVAMTRIILAPTKEDAKAVRDLYAGGVEYEIDTLRFELDRINASNAVFAMVTTTGQYKFTSAEFDYFNNDGIMNYAFDNTSVAIEERADYYTNAKKDLAFRVAQAKGLHDLAVDMSARYATIAGYNDGARLTDATTVAPFLADIDVLAKFDDYKTAIAELDGTALKLDTAEKIDAFVAALDADASIVEYAADKYEVLLQQQKTSADAVVAFDSAVLADSVKTVITTAIADAVVENAYVDAMEAVRQDATLETVDARKAKIDEYIAKKVADCKYEQACAKYLFDVKTAANTADAAIDALTNLTPEQKALLKESYVGDNVPELSSLYTTTGKATTDQYSTDEQWAALLAANTADITAMKTVAEKEDALKADQLAKVADIEAAAAGATTAGLSADVEALGAEFVKFVNAAYAEYTLVTNTAISYVNPTAEQAEAGMSVKQATAVAAGAKLTDLKADTKLALDSYADYIGLVKAADNLNQHILSYMSAFEANFKVIRDTYNHEDTEAVWTQFATERDYLANNWKQDHASAATSTLPGYAFDSAAEYDAAKETLTTFKAAVATALEGIATKTTEFDNYGTTLEGQMKAAFDEKEAAKLAANKTAQRAALDATYEKVLAAIEVEISADNRLTAKAVAGAYYSTACDSIANASRSNEPAIIYNSTFANFAKEVFGLKNSNEYDPADARYAAEGTPEYKTAEEQLTLMLAAY